MGQHPLQGSVPFKLYCIGIPLQGLIIILIFHVMLNRREKIGAACRCIGKVYVYEPKWPIRPELIPVSVASGD